MKAILLFSLALCVAPLLCQGSREQITGQVFEPQRGPKPFFSYHNTRTKTGHKTEAHTRYLDLTGKPAVEEFTSYEDGKLKRYVFRQLQVGAEGVAEIKDNKVYFSFTENGKTETDEEDFESNMVVPDMIQDFLSSSWPVLQAGDSIYIRFLLVERQESIGFKFFKDKEVTYNGIPALEIIMKPSSFFIAAIAPSIRLTLEKEPPHRLLESFGRLPVRLPKDPAEPTKLRAIDGKLVFDRPKARPAAVRP